VKITPEERKVLICSLLINKNNKVENTPIDCNEKIAFHTTRIQCTNFLTRKQATKSGYGLRKFAFISVIHVIRVYKIRAIGTKPTYLKLLYSSSVTAFIHVMSFPSETS
jgi:hypothetical protein